MYNLNFVFVICCTRATYVFIETSRLQNPLTDGIYYSSMYLAWEEGGDGPYLCMLGQME